MNCDEMMCVIVCRMLLVWFPCLSYLKKNKKNIYKSLLKKVGIIIDVVHMLNIVSSRLK